MKNAAGGLALAQECATMDAYELAGVRSRDVCAMNVSSITHRIVLLPDGRVRDDKAAVRIAVVAGVIFFFAGLVKFVFHHWELDAFRSFGLPWPIALEIFAGVLETAGGVLLTLRRCVAPAAALLAVTMVVAIGASGIGHGDVIPSLTLAPVLLIAMLYLLRVATRRPIPTTGRSAA